jgi:hypothetical protein
VFAVALEASTDGGRTFTVHPSAVTGDVGPGVSTGNAKTIVWDSTKDIEDLQIDRYVFRVIVSPVARRPAHRQRLRQRRRREVDPPVRRVPRPVVAARAASAPKSGGLSKGAIIGITGVRCRRRRGCCGVERQECGGHDSRAVSLDADHAADAELHGYLQRADVRRRDNPDGSNPCNHAVVFAGNLTLALDVIAASVTGSATFQGTMVNGATTCNSQGIPSPTPGASSNTIVGSIAVTGSPSSLSFNRQVVSQGTTVSGAPATLTLTFSFGGVLNADTVSGSLTITYRDDTGTGATARIGLATGTVTVTLR